MRLTPILALLLSLAAAKLAAQSTEGTSVELDVSISPAQLAFVSSPEVTLIDSQVELDAFERRARAIPEGNPLRQFRDVLEPLQVDFEAVRLVAICWGPHPFERQARLHLEAARVIHETVRLEVRTSMAIQGPAGGAGGRAATRAPGTPATVYPANIIAVPRTERVIVQLTGARLPSDGFRPRRDERLTVSVAPDSMPLRDRVELLPAPQFYVEGDEPPHVLLEEAGQADKQIVDIAWCQFTMEINSLEVDRLELHGDALHIGVVARRTRPTMYSGPPTSRPRIRLATDTSARVLVHIRRLGDPIRTSEDLVDFQAFTRGRLEVTVEHPPVRKPAWSPGGFGRRAQ